MPDAKDTTINFGFLTKLGAAAGAVIALVTLWKLIGAPIPAWSEDLLKLERQQLETASEVYQQKVDDLTILGAKLKSSSGITDDERSLVTKQLSDARRRLDRVNERMIELSK